MPMLSQFLLFGNYVTFWCLLVGVKKLTYLCTQLGIGREDAYARHNSIWIKQFWLCSRLIASLSPAITK